MYEIQRSEREVNGVKLETWKAEIVSANMLDIEVGTTGYCGGDTGHGGRTYFRIENIASTDMKAKVITDNYGDTKEVIIEIGGDTELDTFIQSLEFALQVLKEQSKE